MAATASVPAYMLPGVSVHQPAHLEGDPALATEILPGPPPLVAVQQAAQKRDSKKPAIHYSYLPPSDPGSTYSGIMHGTLVGQDQGPLNKRSRTDKGCVSCLCGPHMLIQVVPVAQDSNGACTTGLCAQSRGRRFFTAPHHPHRRRAKLARAPRLGFRRWHARRRPSCSHSL